MHIVYKIHDFAHPILPVSMCISDNSFTTQSPEKNGAERILYVYDRSQHKHLLLTLDDAHLP